MTLTLFAKVLLSFLLFTLLFAGAAQLWLLRRNRFEKRLRKYVALSTTPATEPTNAKEPKPNRPGPLRRGLTQAGETFDHLNTDHSLWKKRLEEAGLTLRPSEFLIIRLLTALAGLLLALLLGFGWFLTPLLTLLFYFLPITYVKRKHKQRLERCSHQLAQALGIMANAMRSGFSFLQAMQLIGKEVPDPLGPEFNRMLRDMSLGETMENAFAHLLKRLPDADLELVVTALLIQRSTGGNLAGLLETMQETIRGRVRVKEELKTLTAQGRLSSYVITLLPLVLALYLSLVNPDYIAPFLAHPLGWFLIFIGLTLITLGWVFIQKIIKIEV